MTNADAIRKMGDTELTYFICRNFGDAKKCKCCSVGVDSKNVCKDPKADCEESVFRWLGTEKG